MKEIFGIEVFDDCGECCVGIGQMIIDGDDCTGFIIGPCEEVVEEPPTGEFEPCEFVPSEFTKPTGINYEDCGNGN